MIAGLDIEMGSRSYYTKPLYDQIYVYRNLSESYLNRAVHHLLSSYNRFGLLDAHGSQMDSTDVLLTARSPPENVAKESQDLSAYIAVRSGVLLKNNGVLPLKTLSSIAVLGATGLQLTNGAGFAERSFGFNERKVPPVDAVSRAAPEVDVSSSVGVDMHGSLVPAIAFETLDGRPGVLRNNSICTTVDSAINFQGQSALPGNTSYT
jgi:beta-glucosidase